MVEIPRWAAYTALGVGVASLGAVTVAALWGDGAAVCPGAWVNPYAPEQIRALAKPIEKITNLKGLGDFLSGVAWIESRGNPDAGSDADDNKARGGLGMRPKSAKTGALGMRPNALKDLPTAVALATWYIDRCIPYADPDQEIIWLAFRRCWGSPDDVDEVDHPGYKAQFARGLACAGVDPSFMFKKAIRWNYKWPGIDAVLAAVGRPRALA